MCAQLLRFIALAVREPESSPDVRSANLAMAIEVDDLKGNLIKRCGFQAARLDGDASESL